MLNQQRSLMHQHHSCHACSFFRTGFPWENGTQNTTKKHPLAGALMINQQCSIFPGRHQPSIFDDEKLNFCVRDGNRWILLSIATGYGIITTFVEIIELVLNIAILKKRRIGSSNIQNSISEINSLTTTHFEGNLNTINP